MRKFMKLYGQHPQSRIRIMKKQTPIDAKTWRELYPAVGLLTLNWALLESTLEQLTESLFSKAGGDNLKSELPKNFTDKVDFLRKCFKKLPPLEPFRELGLTYLANSKKISATRHILSHGAIVDFEPLQKRIVFLRLRPEKLGKVNRKQYDQVTVAQILKAQHQSIQLVRSARILELRISAALRRP